jgi:nuclear transport factor 2 (NTF2) superfamily protein
VVSRDPERVALAYTEDTDDSSQWYNACGNENWEFDEHGYMKRRFASINDLPIRETERKFRWEHDVWKIARFSTQQGSFPL